MINSASVAVQPIKEWKPKSTKKSPTTDADNSVADAVSPSASNTENANAPDVHALSDELSHANLHEVEHVIIPEHLRVPEYEQTKLRFGSFMSGFDSEQVPASTSLDSEEPEQLGEPFQFFSAVDMPEISTILLHEADMLKVLYYQVLN